VNGNTRFARCHLCGRSLGGHLPLCSGCYKAHLVDGKPPEWLRFLVNDLKRENRSDTREAEMTDDFTEWLYIEEADDSAIDRDQESQEG